MGSPDPITALDARMGRRLKLSGMLVGTGLLVEMITLYWSHPLAFFVFTGLGAGLVGVGVAVYLFALVSHR